MGFTWLASDMGIFTWQFSTRAESHWGKLVERCSPFIHKWYKITIVNIFPQVYTRKKTLGKVNAIFQGLFQSNFDIVLVTKVGSSGLLNRVLSIPGIIMEFFVCQGVYVVCCAIWYHLYNLKNMKNTHGAVLILVKSQASSLRTWEPWKCHGIFSPRSFFFLSW